MGECETLSDRTRPACRTPETEPPSDNRAEDGLAEQYRRSAEKLRQLAKQIRFDFRRQAQLLSLADAFDRLADRKENAGAVSPPPAS